MPASDFGSDLSALNPVWCFASADAGLSRPELELLEPAQDLGERHHCGEPSSKAALKRADVGHDDVARSAIAPLCGLVDNFFRSSGQEHFSHDR